MKTITITEDQTNRHNLPAKAIGYWAIVEVTDEFAHLHRLKKDGTFGSNRANNIIKIAYTDLLKFELNKEEHNQRRTLQDQPLDNICIHHCDGDR